MCETARRDGFAAQAARRQEKLARETELITGRSA